ncbi:MAG: adaptor protein MecA [Ruminococcus sp.]|nr:adaptor protein MecA [Ruminococcus sp.]
MTIDLLDRETILVSLGVEDMRAYSLRFDKGVGYAENGLKKLLGQLGELCGTRSRGKSYLIEALPAKDGCLLIISVHAAKYRRKYRIKRSADRKICIFFDADAMLDYLSAAKDSEDFMLYRYDGRFVLLPPLTASDSVLARLSEYGELYPASPAALARVREYGSLLMEKNAQRRHIRSRAVTVRDAASRDGGC